MSLSPRGELQLGVDDDVVPDARRAELPEARPDVVLEVTGDQPVDQVGQPVQDEHPSEEEVPAPRGGEVAVRRKGDPVGEALLLDRTVGCLVGAEEAAGVDAQRAHAGHAHDPPVGLVHRADLEPALGVVGVGPVHAPIERRVGVEDVEPARDEEGDADDVDPVAHARDDAVPVIDLPGRRRQGGVGRRVGDTGHRRRSPGLSTKRKCRGRRAAWQAPSAAASLLRLR